MRSTKGFQNFINLEKKEDDYAKKLGEIIVENDVDLQSKEDDIPKLLNQLSKFNKNTNNAIENIQSLFDTLRKIEKLISDFRLSQFVSNTTNKEENGYYTCNKFIEFVKTLLNQKLDTAALITFDTEDIIPIAESNFNKDEKGEQYNIKFKDQKYKKYKVFYNTLAKFLSVAKDVQSTYKKDIQDTIDQIQQSRKELQDIQNKINQGKAKQWEIKKKNNIKETVIPDLKKKKKDFEELEYIRKLLEKNDNIKNITTDIFHIKEDEEIKQIMDTIQAKNPIKIQTKGLAKGAIEPKFASNHYYYFSIIQNEQQLSNFETNNNKTLCEKLFKVYELIKTKYPSIHFFMECLINFCSPAPDDTLFGKGDTVFKSQNFQMGFDETKLLSHAGIINDIIEKNFNGIFELEKTNKQIIKVVKTKNILENKMEQKKEDKIKDLLIFIKNLQIRNINSSGLKDGNISSTVNSFLFAIKNNIEKELDKEKNNILNEIDKIIDNNIEKDVEDKTEKKFIPNQMHKITENFLDKKNKKKLKDILLQNNKSEICIKQEFDYIKLLYDKIKKALNTLKTANDNKAINFEHNRSMVAIQEAGNIAESNNQNTKPSQNIKVDANVIMRSINTIIEEKGEEIIKDDELLKEYKKKIKDIEKNKKDNTDFQKILILTDHLTGYLKKIKDYTGPVKKELKKHLIDKQTRLFNIAKETMNLIDCNNLGNLITPIEAKIQDLETKLKTVKQTVEDNNNDKNKTKILFIQNEDEINKKIKEIDKYYKQLFKEAGNVIHKSTNNKNWQQEREKFNKNCGINDEVIKKYNDKWLLIQQYNKIQNDTKAVLLKIKKIQDKIKQIDKDIVIKDQQIQPPRQPQLKPLPPDDDIILPPLKNDNKLDGMPKLQEIQEDDPTDDDPTDDDLSSSQGDTRIEDPTDDDLSSSQGDTRIEDPTDDDPSSSQENTRIEYPTERRNNYNSFSPSQIKPIFIANDLIQTLKKKKKNIKNDNNLYKPNLVDKLNKNKYKDEEYKDYLTLLQWIGVILSWIPLLGIPHLISMIVTDYTETLYGYFHRQNFLEFKEDYPNSHTPIHDEKYDYANYLAKKGIKYQPNLDNYEDNNISISTVDSQQSINNKNPNHDLNSDRQAGISF